MNPLTKNLLFSVLLAAAASGSVRADVDPVSDCTVPPAARHGHDGFYTDPNEMAGPDRLTASGERFAAASPLAWQPGNPFRDDTAA